MTIDNEIAAISGYVQGIIVRIEGMEFKLAELVALLSCDDCDCEEE